MKYTQDQLEIRSKRKINIILAKLLYRSDLLSISNTPLSTSSISVHFLDGKSKIVDYCNNWADMGPLIEEEGIDIAYYSNGDGYCYKDLRETLLNLIEVEFEKGKTLRAAAIVYILVKQEEL